MTIGLFLALCDAVGAQPTTGTRDTSRAGPNPGGAFRRSLVLPGWGQWYNGRPIKAGVYGGLVMVSAAMALRNWDTAIGTTGPGSIFWSGEAWTRGRNNWLILGAMAYLLGAVDAYVDAQLQTFDVSSLAVRLVPETNGSVVIMAVLPWPDGK